MNFPATFHAVIGGDSAKRGEGAKVLTASPLCAVSTDFVSDLFPLAFGPEGFALQRPYLACRLSADSFPERRSSTSS